MGTFPPGPPPDRLERIFQKVIEDATQLVGTRGDGRNGGADDTAEGDAAVRRFGPPRRQGLLHEVGKIDRAQVEPLLAGKALEVADHQVEPARRLAQLINGVADAAERLTRVSLEAACDTLREH